MRGLQPSRACTMLAHMSCSVLDGLHPAARGGHRSLRATRYGHAAVSKAPPPAEVVTVAGTVMVILAFASE